MANVLGNLFTYIADAIRTKTGDTNTMKPIDFPANIMGISSNDRIETEILPKQEMTFEIFDETTGVYRAKITPSPLEFIEGKKYKGVFDGEEYTLIATYNESFDTCFIGNSAIVMGVVGGEGEDTGEPFAIGNFMDALNICTLDTNATHIISISVIDEVLPATVKFDYSSFTADENGSPQIVEHDLGVVPDFVYVHIGDAASLTDSSGFVMTAFGFSDALVSTIPNFSTQYSGIVTIKNTVGELYTWHKQKGIDVYEGGDDVVGSIREANATSFTVGGTSWYLQPSGPYYWFALSIKT